MNAAFIARRCAFAFITSPALLSLMPFFILSADFINPGEYGHCIETKGVGLPCRARLSAYASREIAERSTRMWWSQSASMSMSASASKTASAALRI